MNNETIANRLKQIAIKNMLTQEQIAKKIGLLRTQWRKYVVGETLPGTNILLKIHKAFPDVDLHWLITGTKKEAVIKTVSLHDLLKKDNPKIEILLYINSLKQQAWEAKTDNKKIEALKEIIVAGKAYFKHASKEYTAPIYKEKYSIMELLEVIINESSIVDTLDHIHSYFNQNNIAI